MNITLVDRLVLSDVGCEFDYDEMDDPASTVALINRDS